jgi:ectoine hydroxylase
VSHTDPYHSRSQEQWEIARRDDPCVWSERTEADGEQLSRDQLTQYAERGFLVRWRLFDTDEVAALKAAADALRADADPTRDDVIAEASSNAIRSVFRVHRDGGVFHRLAADRRLAGTARQILDSDVYIHQSRINFKPGFDGRPFPWHSDFETWHVEDGMPRPRALSASVLLTDNLEQNGPLMVIPGSHQLFVRCVGKTPENHFKSSLVNQTYGVPSRGALIELVERGGIASATGPAGSVIFFDSNLMHGSGGNITPLARNNVFLVFNSVDNAVVDPFGTAHPRPEFLAERQVEPLPR